MAKVVVSKMNVNTDAQQSASLVLIDLLNIPFLQPREFFFFLSSLAKRSRNVSEIIRNL